MVDQTGGTRTSTNRSSESNEIQAVDLTGGLRRSPFINAARSGKDAQGKRTRLTHASFEGHSRLLTIGVISIASMWLVLLETEHSVLDGQYTGLTFVDITLNFIIVVSFAVCSGLIAYLILQANFRSQEEKEYNFYLVLSIVSLVIGNVGLYFTVLDVRDTGRGRNLKGEKAGSFALNPQNTLIIPIAIMMLLVDLSFFLRIFRPYREHLSKKTPLPHSRLDHGLSISATRRGLERKPAADVGLITCMAIVDTVIVNTILGVNWLFDVLVKNPLTKVWEFGGGVAKMVKPRPRGSSSKCFLEGCKCMTGWIREKNAKARYATRDSSMAMQSYQIVVLSCDQIVNHWSFGLSFMKEVIKDLFLHIQEDDDFKHSGWVLGAVVTSLMVLVYATFKTMGFLRWVLTEEYDRRKQSVVNPENQVRKVLDNFLVSTVLREYSTDLGFSEIDTMCVDRGSCVDEFLETDLGNLVRYIDAVLVEARWCLYVGYGLGAVVAAFSLLSVLAQYKRLILAMEVYVDGRKVKQEDQVRLETPQLEFVSWRNLVQTYPLGWTVYFFGILVSTMFLQLQIFGLVFTWSLSTALSFRTVAPFADRILRVVFAFALVWFTNNVFSRRVVANGLLTKREKILFPRLWILYTIVYTIVHIITGILYAVQRIVYLAFTAFLSIARLDKNVLESSVLPLADAGHKSFMSMVLMHNVIRRNTEDETLGGSQSDAEDEVVDDGWEEPGTIGAAIANRHAQQSRTVLQYPAITTRVNLRASRKDIL
ncbi:hypothetical protein BSKO_06377 [Bryopsis sp. KO-2023]|nr:hypothetical protein BSKO_06377 [Bryopsis sp. KO-2023]